MSVVVVLHERLQKQGRRHRIGDARVERVRDVERAVREGDAVASVVVFEVKCRSSLYCTNAFRNRVGDTE